MGTRFESRFSCFKSKTIRDFLVKIDDELVKLEDMKSKKEECENLIRAIDSIRSTPKPTKEE